ncbi:alanine racemase [Psychrobacter sp. AH5]|uniref:alanine racemase n=1 Tax=Psychrobacter sp. AH5 TaxID=2937433 RepID=UPI00333F461B
MDFANIIPRQAPSAWLDMDALDHNIQRVNHKTQAVKLRLATKSIRSIEVLSYIKDSSPHYIGLMSYTAAESVYLLENGFDNILCAYPTLDSASVAKTFTHTAQGATMIWMVDRPEHVELLDKVAQDNNASVDICLDINMSMPLPKLYFGTKRSALMSKKDVKALLKTIKQCANVKLTGVMGYEAQIAGLAEQVPGKALLSPAIRLLKNRSKKQLSQRRRSIVAWLKKQGYELQLVNGGGSGSMDFTSSQPEITEISVGSAYFKPAYFDYMESMQAFKPAAGFVLPVTRQPECGVITCQGGGFIASGAAGADKVPVIHYPSYLSVLTDEGFGEVQTPMLIDKKTLGQNKAITIGDYVWCRHAKAGELCEHFNELVVYSSSQKHSGPQTSHQELKANKAFDTMMTYRGAGQCFH